MNKKLLTVLLAGTILSAGSAMAQNAPAQSPVKDSEVVTRMEKLKDYRQQRQAEMARKLSDDLGLTDEQRAEAEQLREKGRKKIEPLMEEMMTLHQQINQERRENLEEFENILTPAQKQRFEQIKQGEYRRFDRRRGGVKSRHIDRRHGDIMSPSYGRMPNDVDPDQMMRGMHRVHQNNLPYDEEGMLPPPPPGKGMKPHHQKDIRSKRHQRRYQDQITSSLQKKRRVQGFVQDEELTDEALEMDQGGFVEE